jgi:hypothetical protein
MKIKELDTVVLTTNIESSNLKVGDIGAVVAVVAPDTYEVEFVMASGKTQALVSLKSSQVRPVGPNDLPTVRQLDAA